MRGLAGRVEHLSVVDGLGSQRPGGSRSPRGSGSKVQIRPGVWKLRVTVGRYAEGSVRRVHRTVRAGTAAEAAHALAAFVAEGPESPPVESKGDRGVTGNEAIERVL